VAASCGTGEAAVETVSEGSGVVRLLEKEPTEAERYAHAAELLAIIQRADAARACRSASQCSYISALLNS
jgi:hypothetical protein